MRNEKNFDEHLNSWKKHIQPKVRNPFMQNPHMYFEDSSFRDHIFLKNEEFQSYLRNDFQETFYETQYHPSLLRNRMLNELNHEAIPVILHEDDLNCMYHSIENRSPYLDHELMEYAYKIPQEYLMRDGMAKVILRDSMKGILNDKVRLDRHKKGFNASIHSLINFENKQVNEMLLDNSPIYEILRKDKIEKALKDKNPNNSFSKFLFYFLNSKIFIDQRS